MTLRRIGRRLLGHRRARAGAADEATFMMLLDRELERARRHDRTFGLTRFVVDRTTPDHLLSTRVVEQIRVCDVAVVVDDQLVVLWSETLPTDVGPAIERVLRAGRGALSVANSVAFPSTALTRAALLGQLFAPPVEVPVVRAERAVAEVPSQPAPDGSSRLAS